jgi:hypothetical protein
MGNRTAIAHGTAEAGLVFTRSNVILRAFECPFWLPESIC